MELFKQGTRWEIVYPQTYKHLWIFKKIFYFICLYKNYETETLPQN